MSYCFYCMQPLQDDATFCPFCGNSRTADTAPHHLPCGTVLRSRYLIGTALGEGGFGITYIGRDTVLNVRVAVKEYYPNGYTNRSSTVSLNVFPPTSGERREFFEKGRRSFLNEARTMASFSDEPGIVNVRDFFEENNTAYIVMEYLDGVTMKAYLKQNGVMRYDELLPMMMPLMRSLQKVHEADLIHRDISPDNIMMVGDRLKLLDFGAARNVSAEGNKSLSVMLKPGYAPEEQYRSRGSQGPWTDVYALCATIYKCLTGVTPDDSTERLVNDRLQPPSALGVSLPPAADAAIMRGLAVSAQNRIQSVEELMNALLSADNQPGQADDADFTQLLNGQYYGPQNIYTDVAADWQGGTDDTQLLYGQPAYTATVPQPVRQPVPQRSVTRDPVSQRPITQRPITQQPMQQPVPAQMPKKKKSKGAVIAVVAVMISLVIAALVIAVVLIIKNNDSSTESGSRRNNSSDVTSDYSTDADYVPQWVTDYNPPANWDYDFSLNGHSYRMLMPLQLLLDDGWVPDLSPNVADTVSPGETWFFPLQRGNYSVSVEIRNIDSRAAAPAYCAVTSIEINNYSGTNASFSMLMSDTEDIPIGLSKESFFNRFSNIDVSNYPTMSLYFVDAHGNKTADGQAEIHFMDDRIYYIKIACTELY